jgi:hypothetical protein
MQRNDINWSYADILVDSTSPSAPTKLKINSLGKFILYLHLSYSATASQLRLRIFHNGAQIFPLSGWVFLALNNTQQFVIEVDKMLIGPSYGLEVQAYINVGSTALGVGIASSERASYGDGSEIIEWLEKIFTVLRMRLAPPLLNHKNPKEDKNERGIS